MVPLMDTPSNSVSLLAAPQNPFHALLEFIGYFGAFL